MWDPFPPGPAEEPAKNGARAEITSASSQAFEDAALGGHTYAIKIVTASSVHARADDVVADLPVRPMIAPLAASSPFTFQVCREYDGKVF